MSKATPLQRYAIALSVALLAGCGQKGPLYLPDDQKAAKEHRHDVF